jgi:hypothetical protein
MTRVDTGTINPDALRQEGNRNTSLALTLPLYYKVTAGELSSFSSCEAFMESFPVAAAGLA